MKRTARCSRAALIAAILALPLAWLSDRVEAQSRPGNGARGKAQSQRTATPNNVPNALQGFSKNRDKPIQIEASSLEVQDKTKVATFSGKVYVKQGDTELRCNTLVVHYEQNAGATSGSQSVFPASDAQRIRLLEAKGKVIVTQKDQIATGDAGVFDMRKNTITLQGNVVISQGGNVLRGDRLVVDMTTAVSRIESERGRVQGLFQPSARDGDSRRNGSSIMPRLR